MQMPMQMNNSQMANMMQRQMVNNPRQFAQNMLKTGRFNGNEMLTNALNAIANGDIESTKCIAQNLCKEHNVTVEDAMTQYRQYYGIN